MTVGGWEDLRAHPFSGMMCLFITPVRLRGTIFRRAGLCIPQDANPGSIHHYSSWMRWAGTAFFPSLSPRLLPILLLDFENREKR